MIILNLNNCCDYLARNDIDNNERLKTIVENMSLLAKKIKVCEECNQKIGSPLSYRLLEGILVNTLRNEYPKVFEQYVESGYFGDNFDEFFLDVDSDTVIATRNEYLLDWLAERDIIGRAVTKPTAENIKGKDVYGDIPLELAALANKVTLIRYVPPKELDGIYPTKGQLDKYVEKMTEYKVTVLSEK